MEPNAVESPVPQEKKGVAPLLFAIIFEILFVGVILFILIFLLNYFNVFSLAKFSQKLSFLPHLRSYNNTANTTSQPIPSSAVYAQYDYSEETAKNFLTGYIGDVLKPSLLPDKIFVYHTPNDPQAHIPPSPLFTLAWTKNDVSITVFYTYVTASQSASTISSIIQLPKDLPVSFTENSATAITNQYFAYAPKFAGASWHCVPENSIPYCEKMITVNDSYKEGMGIDQITINNQKVYTAYTCKIFAASPNFSSSTCNF